MISPKLAKLAPLDPSTRALPATTLKWAPAPLVEADAPILNVAVLLLDRLTLTVPLLSRRPLMARANVVPPVSVMLITLVLDVFMSVPTKSNVTLSFVLPVRVMIPALLNDPPAMISRVSPPPTVSETRIVWPESLVTFPARVTAPFESLTSTVPPKFQMLGATVL